MKRLLLVGCLFFLGGQAEIIAAAGSENSGGMDFHSTRRAWFTSQDYSRKLRVCYEMSPDFLPNVAFQGVTPQRVEQMIVDAFKQWETYYKEIKKLKTESWDQDDNTSLPPREIAFQIVGPVSKQCRGDEDLTFYFGVTNDRVQKAKEKMVNPFAFAAVDADEAEDSKGSPKAHWSRGFIWLANTGAINPKHSTPLWTNYQGLPLKRILLHELGHVMGCAHNRGTIMEEDFNWFFEKTQLSHSKRLPSYFRPSDLRRLNSIDHYVDLVTNINETETYHVEEVADENSHFQHPTVEALFSRIIGKNPIGNVSAQFIRSKFNPSYQTNPAPNLEGSGILRIRDAKASYDLKIVTKALISDAETWVEDLAFYVTSMRGKTARSYFGYLEFHNGKKLPVAINYNMDLSRFALIDLSGTPPPASASPYYSPRWFLLQAY